MECESVLQQITDYIEQHYSRERLRIVFLGDIFDSPHVGDEATELFFRYVSQWAQKHHIVIILGNHDPNKEGADKFALLRYISQENICIVRDFKAFKFGDMNELFLAYKAGRPADFFKPDKMKQFDVVAGHFSINRFLPSDIGNLPVDVTQGPWYIAGHLHTPAQDHNLIHPGSCIGMAFDEGEMSTRHFLTGTMTAAGHFQISKVPLKTKEMIIVEITDATNLDILAEFNENYNVKIRLKVPVALPVLKSLERQYNFNLLKIDHDYANLHKIKEEEKELGRNFSFEGTVAKHYELNEHLSKILSEKEFFHHVNDLVQSQGME